MFEKFAGNNNVEGRILSKRAWPLQNIMVHRPIPKRIHSFDARSIDVHAHARSSGGSNLAVEPSWPVHPGRQVIHASDIKHLLPASKVTKQLNPRARLAPPRPLKRLTAHLLGFS